LRSRAFKVVYSSVAFAFTSLVGRMGRMGWGMRLAVYKGMMFIVEDEDEDDE
jgi:hypothetical protein